MNLREATAEEILELIAMSPPEPPPRPRTPDMEIETWPPVWKPWEESPQFRYGLLQYYLKVEEDLKHYDTTAIPYHEHNVVILKFLKQVRESRGYDVDFDSCPPEFKSFPLKPLPFQLLCEEDNYREHLYNSVYFVVAKMNARAQACGLVYEFGEIENVVFTARTLHLITFLVNEISPNADRVKKVVQAMTSSYGKNQFTLYDLRFKPEPQVATTTSTAFVASSSLN